LVLAAKIALCNASYKPGYHVTPTTINIVEIQQLPNARATWQKRHRRSEKSCAESFDYLADDNTQELFFYQIYITV